MKLKVWLIIVGAAISVAGVLALAFPFASSLAVEYLVGALLLVSGVSYLVLALSNRRSKGFVPSVLGALVYGIAGGAMLLFPLHGLVLLSLILGAYLVASGITKIYLGWSMRPFPAWWLPLASGCVSIVLAALIVVLLPYLAFRVIGIFVGIDMLLTGAWLIVSGASFEALELKQGVE